MPKKAERALRQSAMRKFGSTTSERARRYIFGGLRHTSWVQVREHRRGK